MLEGSGGRDVYVIIAVTSVDVNIPSGGCEKIDFCQLSYLQSEKLRARMPYKRLLRIGYTFPFKNKAPTKSAISTFSHPPVPR
jgi:hypothetical protein